MTAEQQVKEIIKMLNPENPNDPGVDAVFLVQKLINKANARDTAKDKQIALLEAKLEAKQLEKHNLENEKLAAETRLKDEKKQILDEKGIRPTRPGDKPGPGGGRTI